MSGRPDAFCAARGTIDGLPGMIAVQAFDFLGGSLGMAVGESFVAAVEAAIADKRPFLLFVASGNARMQESMLSLMQMPRTSIAVQMLKEAGLPYVIVLTDPTFGGVSASYAMLGDVQIVVLGVLFGFVGACVFVLFFCVLLLVGFQRAEYLLKHGMLDMVVHRHEMRETLSRLLHLLMKQPRSKSKKMPSPAPNGNGHAAPAQ